jgi:putative transcriptional regulator
MQHIRRIRESFAISVKDLAEAINTETSTVYHYETGRRTPDFNQCWNIVNSLNKLGANCSFSDVFPNPVETSSQDDQTLNP